MESQAANLERDERTHPSETGEFRFASAEERDSIGVRLAAAGLVVAELEGIGPSARGRLGERIGETIERELASRGAPGPAVDAAGDTGAMLGDQLYRALRSGATGIGVVLGPLRAVTDDLGALDPVDCRVLRALIRATAERRVVLLLDESDRTTGGYGEPVPLERLVRGQDGEAREPQRHIEPPPVEPPPPASPEAAAGPVRGIDRHTAGASVVEQEEAWRRWTLQLTAAKGPQPLAMLERLFAESYVPLSTALAAGLDDPRARSAVEDFRAAFSRSYAEAFPTLAVSAKRPRMVLDVHDVAARIGRLHGARASRLLLVDAMRWDLSRMVQQRVSSRLGMRAAITDELILWSALPSTTLRQLETIGRGVDALRAPGPLDDQTEVEALRGRTADYVRRLRVGPRELHKLDLVHARLQAVHGGVVAALPALADEAAMAIVRHVETLPPRTLLLVFGDHGFAVDRRGGIAQGGASPEEVLCGAFGLLVGEVN
jgi:hypothetical protein